VFSDFDSSSNEVIIDSSEFIEDGSGPDSVEIVTDDCNDKWLVGFWKVENLCLVNICETSYVKINWIN